MTDVIFVRVSGSVVVVRSHQRWNRSQGKNRVERGRMNDHKPFKDRTRSLVRCRLRG